MAELARKQAGSGAKHPRLPPAREPMVRPTLAAAVGNQAIQTLLHGGWLRAKLELGEGAVGTPIGAPGRISEPGSGFPPTARETFWQLGLSGALRF